MNIIGRWRRLSDRLAKREQRRQKELETRLINVPHFVKEMLDDTRAILNEPEQEENGTWNVEVSEYTYQLLMRERLGTSHTQMCQAKPPQTIQQSSADLLAVADDVAECVVKGQEECG